MERVFTVSDRIVIASDPATLYDAVSDVTRMGEWSPENTGASVDGGSRPAHVGMIFEGTNKRGKASWITRCTVTAAEPDKRFAFRVHAIGAKVPRLKGPVATWEYRFETADGGTRVTETWTDDRRKWPDVVARAFDALATGGKTFAEFQQGNIRRTLKELKAVAEG